MNVPGLKFPKPSRQTRLTKKTKGKRTHQKETSQLWRIVRMRDGRCTAAPGFGPHFGGLELDHQWGRGKGCPPQTVENTRLLCEGHHHLKTDSDPTRIAWLEDFRAHAARHGYGAEVARVDVAVQLERAQHPGHRKERAR